MDKYIDASALGQVLLVSIVAGVGLVAVFALGLRGLAAAEDGQSAGRVVAAGSFAIVLAGVAFGVWSLLAAT